MSDTDTTSAVIETVDENSNEIASVAKVVGISVTAVAAYRSLEVLTHKALVFRARRRAEKAVKDAQPAAKA